MQGTFVDSIKSFADVGTVEQDDETLKLNWSMLRARYGIEEEKQPPPDLLAEPDASDASDDSDLSESLQLSDYYAYPKFERDPDHKGPEFGEIKRFPVELLDELEYEGIDAHEEQLAKWHRMHRKDDFNASPYRDMSLIQRDWCNAVETYSACNLSFSKDKLIAISGMAKRMSEEMQCQYLAGLWRKDLEHWLLWKVVVARGRLVDCEGRGPSWSWASVDGTIRYDRLIGWFYNQ